MKVKEIMSNGATSCDLNVSLADAAKLMWDGDCGVLPVLKEGTELVGMITDRDICMATAMRDRNSSSISVEEVITGDVYKATPEEDVLSAMETMRLKKVRRLPVVEEGKLVGILSLNDIVLNAKGREGKKVAELTFEDVVGTFKAICAHPVPVKESDKSMPATA
ncbi:MAG TPA: CBS domain-containing protein [Pyrinomonadaceae bacterium]|nr:CBS domain-containing protein [Pyrinomonadaceae bacterium]